MFPKSGTKLPGKNARPTEEGFHEEIRRALRVELGDTSGATKIIMGWTGASDRTARNWMTGASGPSGYHLICLARGSSAVLAAMLDLCGRPELALSTDVHAVEVALAKAMGSLEVLRRQQAMRPQR